MNDILEDIQRAHGELVAKMETMPPLPHTIMASPLVPWPAAYRQWTSDGRLLLWVNADAILSMPRRDAANHYLDCFTNILPITVPIVFV